MKLAVVGLGSVGKRHAGNLHECGVQLVGMEPRTDRREEASAALPFESLHATLEETLAVPELDGVIVASPPRFHVEQCIAALELGLPVLLEKPVSPRLDDALRLQEAARTSKAPLLLGYTWRWWPSLRRTKALLHESAIGTLRYVKFFMSAHLADWHPWEPYQDFFMASKELGGGALLDESHWIDVMLWFFGMPATLCADIGTISSLEIETDDNVDMLARYQGGLRAYVHLDLYGRPHEKSIQFIGEAGTLLWEPNRVRIGRTMDPDWQEETFTDERNSMFVAVAREFLQVVRGEAKPGCTLEDGLRVLKIVEAARASSSAGSAMELKE